MRKKNLPRQSKDSSAGPENNQDILSQIGADVRRIMDSKDEAEAMARTGLLPDARVRRVRRQARQVWNAQEEERRSARSGNGQAAGAKPSSAQPVQPAREETADPAVRRETIEEETKHRRMQRGTVYVLVSYLFVFLFLALIGWMLYFNIYLRQGIQQSPYNKRQNAMADYTTRGDIVSADGVLLATTQTDEEGNETRIYPEGRAFAHIVGYNTHGKSGIESVANYQLLATHESILHQVINDLRGRKNRGDTVITTIDSRLQRAAYEALEDRQGAIVAIDVKTGAIKALVSKPDFDPNAIAENWEDIVSDETSSVLVNRATQGRYVPGSTFKLVTSLAYLRKYGTIDGYSFNCTGEYTAGGNTIHCFNNDIHGQQDFYGILANSCNCAFADIGVHLGGDLLRKTAESVLFNKTLPTAGLVYNTSSFTLKANSPEALIVQTSFGQGETLTCPFHMALLSAAIAGDGKLKDPYLVESVTSADGGPVAELQIPEALRFGKTQQLMSVNEAATLKKLMINNVESGMYSTLIDFEYPVGGKTGSADFIRADGTEGTHAWFVGFSNTGENDLAIAVIIEDGLSGTKAAIPVAKSVWRAYYSE